MSALTPQDAGVYTGYLCESGQLKKCYGQYDTSVPAGEWPPMICEDLPASCEPAPITISR